MDEKSYEALLAKPPEGICGWPLVLIIEFKEAVYEANLVLNQLKSSEWGKKRLKRTFIQKAEKVCGFYRLQDEITQRKHHVD